MSIPHEGGSHLVWLLRPHGLWIGMSVVTGLLAGAATVALLATVNGALHRAGGMTRDGLLLYVALCVVALAGRGASDVCTNLVGQRVVAQLRKGLAEHILHAPLQALERFPSHRLMPILTADVEIVSHVAFTLSATLISAAVAAGCLLYLAFLSLGLFVLMLTALVVGTVIQAWAQGRGMRGFWSVRDREEQLHKAYRTLTEGAKELRLYRERRDRLRQQMTDTVDAIRTVNGKAVNTYVIAKAFGAALFFLLIALVLAWGSRYAVDAAVLSGFVLVLLFLKGPMDQIATALPTFGRARIALQRIEAVRSHFAQREAMDKTEAGRSTDLLRTVNIDHFERIELRGVAYAFDHNEAKPAGQGEGREDGFALGPINLVLRRGEMVFIVGNNGSGKTTCMKLLLGLYPPTSGEILLDGELVTGQNRDSYRQLFGAVCSDFHLFEEVVAQTVQGGDATQLVKAQMHLRRLGLDRKAHIRDGRFSTTDLSTGQRKRLALLQVWLDARPVLVFDEWAADQDPEFRHQFYTEFLPELRSQGHLLIVITHDDRCFHLADRVLRMHEGRLMEEPRTAMASQVPRANPRQPEPALNTALHRRIQEEGLARPSTWESAMAALHQIRSESVAGGVIRDPRQS